jgi:FixJ family two-component response regulator
MRSPLTGSRVVGIVDDDPSLLRALRRLLQAVGFTVETFESGEAFFQSIRPRPNCLVLDIHLGPVTGFDLHESLVASGESVPTVFITGQDDDATRERARQAGAVAYLCKPFNDQSLISAIELALTRS